MKWVAVWGAAILVAMVLLAGRRDSVTGVPVALPAALDAGVSAASAGEWETTAESGPAESSLTREVARVESAAPRAGNVESVSGAVLEVTGKSISGLVSTGLVSTGVVEHEGIQVLASVLGADGSVRSEYGAALDRRGKARIEFPRGLRLQAWEHQPSNVRVRVVGPGWQRRFQFAKPATPGDFSLLRASLKIAKGITVPGIVSSRLHGRPGEAVNGTVEVYSISSSGLGNGSSWRSSRGSIFGYPAPGRFELYVEASRTLDLWADAGGFGSGRLTGVEIDVDAPPDWLEIRVGGGAAIRGRLVTPAGGPSAVTELRVRRTKEHGTHGRVRSLKGVGSVWAEEGRIDAVLRSQPDGTFEFRGLRPGEYVLSAKRPRRPEPIYPMLAQLRAEAHPEEVEIVLATPRIVVRLYDSAGSPWCRPRLERTDPRSVHPGSWPDWPRVTVSDGGPSGVTRRAGQQRYFMNWDPSWKGKLGDGGGDGARELPAHEGHRQVPGDRQYLVTVRGGDFLPETRWVEVAASDSDVVLEFHAVEDRGLGTIEAVIEPAPGEFLPSGSVAILDIASGDAIASHYRVQGPFRFTLPPGEYGVELRPCAQNTSHGIIEARSGSYVAKHVVVTHNQVTEVVLPVAAGGRMEVTVNGEPKPFSAKDPTRSSLLEWQNEEKRRDASGRLTPEGVSLQLLHASGASERVTRLVTTETLGRSFRSESFDFPIGFTLESEEVSAGSFTLIATLPNGREVSRPISIRAGATTPVTIDCD